MANSLYTAGMRAVGDGTANFLTTPVKALLVDSGYTFDVTHKTLTDLDLGLNEIAGTGYGRLTLANPTMTQDDGLTLAVFDADDISWVGITSVEAAAALVLFFDVDGNDANAIPVAFIDSGFPISLTGGDVNVIWDAQGILGY